jgi:hypothetical protein
MAGHLSVGKRQTHPGRIGRGNRQPQSGRCGEARKQRIGRDAAVGGMKWVNVKGHLRNIVLPPVAAILLMLPAAGQLKVGETSNTLNGTLSAGYNGDFGNQMPSDHSLSFGGTGTLSGYYYNPNFLSYTVSPYLNQARDNSSFQSISDASGVNFDSSIFAGSKFPGAITYAKALNSEGNYAIPGVANYTTKGNSDTVGIAWSEILPGLPSLSANFQDGNNQYSIYGSNGNGSTNSKSFSLRSGYLLSGFNMSAYFTDGDSHANIPQVLAGSSQPLNSTSSNRGYGFAVGHQLPLHGGFSAAINRSDVDSNFDGYSYNGNIDTYTGTASFQPTNKFHFSLSTNYSDNLTGSLYQAITSAGGLVVPPSQSQSSNSLDLQGQASYAVMTNMQLLASADRRQQYFLGKNYSADSYGGGFTYGHVLFGGNFNTALTVTENTISTSSANELGFSGTVNYNRRFSDGWAIGVFGNYSQNVQTLLITYMASFYGYGGNIRRRWGKLGWSAGASVNKTGLTDQAGTTSSGESYNSSINYSNWFALNATYSKSDGNGIETGAGLAATPTPQPVLNPTDLIIFGGKSYSFGLSSNPKRRLTVAATYAKAIGNSNVLGILSENNTEQINTLIQYQFRKMYFTGGYSRLDQSFSISNAPPAKISAFYFGVSRWFNFF